MSLTALLRQFSFYLVLILPLFSRALPYSTLSASRAPEQNYLDVISLINLQKTLNDTRPSIYFIYSPSLTAAQSALDLRISAQFYARETLPSYSLHGKWQEWTSKESPNTAFRKIRDSRIIKFGNTAFPRRPTWLYPDDGCAARAAIAAYELESLGYPAPNKIFAFGNLEIQTPNSPDGSVNWWFHVVVGYKYRNDVIIFDPSIEPASVLTLRQWLMRMNAPIDANVELSICDKGAINPTSNCQTKMNPSEGEVLLLQQKYLLPEWQRLEDLGRQPELELGDTPPWSLIAN